MAASARSSAIDTLTTSILGCFKALARSPFLLHNLKWLQTYAPYAVYAALSAALS
jgi:hypothetical protein